MFKAAKHQVDVLGSVTTSTLALWRGTSVAQVARQPKLPLTLYDMEGSPHCRLVREALTALGLDAEIRPCPKGGQRYRPEVMQLGGKLQFPFFVDPNTKTQMYESRDIVDYLFRTYGDEATPPGYATSAVAPMLGALGSLLREFRGIKVRPSRAPKQPLALWSFESSPYSRLVRERLTELEIPYTLHNLGKEQFADMGPAVMRVKPGPYQPKKGGKREQVLKQLGRVQVPYLEDPNPGAKLFESAAIVDYLEQQYAA